MNKQTVKIELIVQLLKHRPFNVFASGVETLANSNAQRIRVPGDLNNERGAPASCGLGETFKVLPSQNN